MRGENWRKFHMSYAFEKEKYRVIRDGRVDLLDSVSRLLPDGTEGVLSKDALRHRKNMLIATVTVFTRSAMDGGLPEELAYAMSDSYILMGEECTSAMELNELSDRAFREYTYAVAARKNDITAVRSRRLCTILRFIYMRRSHWKLWQRRWA